MLHLVGIYIDEIFRGATCKFDDQPGGTIRSLFECVDIDTLLKAVARFGRKLQCARCLSDAGPVEVCDLKQNICRVVVDSGMKTTHDACDGDWFFRIAYREHRVIEFTIHLVERRYLFPGTSAPHDDTIFR